MKIYLAVTRIEVKNKFFKNYSNFCSFLFPDVKKINLFYVYFETANDYFVYKISDPSNKIVPVHSLMIKV